MKKTLPLLLAFALIISVFNMFLEEKHDVLIFIQMITGGVLVVFSVVYYMTKKPLCKEEKKRRVLYVWSALSIFVAINVIVLAIVVIFQ